MGMQIPRTDFVGGFGRIAQSASSLGRSLDETVSQAQAQAELKKKMENFDAFKSEYANHILTSDSKMTPSAKKIVSRMITGVVDKDEFINKVAHYEFQRQEYARNPSGPPPSFGISIPEWQRQRESDSSRSVQQEEKATQKALGQTSRDVAAGAGLASPVQDPTTGEEAFTEQGFGPPPQTQEQALGRFAEFQMAGQAPEATAKDVLGQPAIGALRPEKELAAEALKVKREARITEDAQTRSQQRQQRLGQQERQLSATVLKAKKGNKTVGDAMDGLFKSVNKSMKEVDKAISAQEKIVRETAAGWGDDHAKTKKEEQDLQAIEEELKAAEDARVYVVNKYSADLTSGKVDLAISMAKDEIQKGVYQGIGAIFQKLRAGGGLGPQPAPAADPAAPATSPDAPNLRQKYNY